MTYLMQKLWIMKWVSIVFIVLLVACTNEQRYTCQVNDDEEYLKAPSLHALSTPSDIILPMQNSNYEIPVITRNSSVGSVGKGLDICPPTSR